ncbi:MAG TPA: TetR/AcrR family transcriptional regulator C-terminal domain-containing protein [Gaiellaceae bacterium]
MATTRRKPLSRERILAAALDVADEQGIDALSMRKLGQSLGYEAMSLYNHVAKKDDVVDGILDLVLAEIELPDTNGGVAAIRRSALSVHEALKRHPWAAALLMERLRPARLEFMNSLLGALRNAGFSAETTYHAYHVLDAHVIGFSLWQTTHGTIPADVDDVGTFVDRMVPAATFPHLHDHAMQHLEAGPHQDVPAFEYGLDLLLESLERLR